MIKKRVLRDRQSLALACHISTPGTHNIKDNIYVKILVTLCQSSLHVSHLVAAAGYVGPSYKNYILFIDFGKTGWYLFEKIFSDFRYA